MDPNCLLFNTIQVKGQIVHCKARQVNALSLTVSIIHEHFLFDVYSQKEIFCSQYS